MSGKLIFIHGVMDAGKSSLLIQKAFQFDQKGIAVDVIKPCLDTRSPSGKVRSDIGIEWPCLDVGAEERIVDAISLRGHSINTKVVLVDEAQFLQERQVDELAAIADANDILVIAYGLKNDFTGHLFKATKRFIELADRVDELPSMCQCGHKATHHFIKVQTDSTITCGDSDLYISCCRRCYNNYKATENETKKDRDSL